MNIQSRMEMQKQRIKLLVLRVTDSCNLNCLYCYALGGNRRDDMSWRVARKTIDYVAQGNDSFKIQFTGGEPLHNFELIERIIEYVARRKLKVKFQLQTNGTLISRELAEKIRYYGIAVGVSLDGKPGINDYLRPLCSGEGSTAAVISGIKNLRAEGIKVGLTAVLSNKNTAHLPELVDLASYLGNIYGIALDLFRPLGRGKNSSIAAPEANYLTKSLLQSFKRADQLSSGGGNRVRFRELEGIKYQLQRKVKRDHYCYATTGESIAVMPKGQVYPCSSLAGLKDFLFGNIMDRDFNSQELQNPIIASEGTTSSNCSSCSYDWLCGGGCFARRIAYHGNTAEPFIGDCILKKTAIKYIQRHDLSLINESS